jgi:hypothetical protein
MTEKDDEWPEGEVSMFFPTSGRLLHNVKKIPTALRMQPFFFSLEALESLCDPASAFQYSLFARFLRIEMMVAFNHPRHPGKE